MRLVQDRQRSWVVFLASACSSAAFGGCWVQLFVKSTQGYYFFSWRWGGWGLEEIHCVSHGWIYLSCKGNLRCRHILFPLRNSGFSLIQLLSRWRPKESLVLGLGWSLLKKKQLLGFLQPLLVFPLQRERRGMDTPHLTVTGTAGDGSEVPPCCRHRRLWENSMKWKYQHTSKAELLPLSTQGWLARSHLLNFILALLL